MNGKQRYAQYVQALAGQRLPAAWIDMDLLDRNIAAIAQRCQGRQVRVVTKSIRCRTLLRYILDQRGPYRGLMCYHPAEAAWLASKGFDDILVAYPSLCETSLSEVAAAIARGKTLHLMVDSLPHLQMAARIASAANVRIPVCIDVDMSVRYPVLHFGVYRSPVDTPEKALALLDAINQFPQLRLSGIMGYEAQIAGVADKQPGAWLENTIVRRLKQQAIPVIHARRGAVVAALRSAGTDLDFVNGGGTGSIESTIADPSVTEVAVGSGFYSPRLFDFYQGFRHQPAAGFATQVTRIPAPGLYTAHSGGFIASGATGAHKAPQAYLPTGMQLTRNEGCGEVQTPFTLRKPQLQQGDAVFWRHAKAGELCERFDTLLAIRGGRIDAEYPTYRGETRNFA